MLSLLLAATEPKVPGSGYLFELLRALGAGRDTAEHVQDLLLRPVTLLVIVVVASLVSHFGSRLIRRLV
ncbi:MAG: hypothetical protein ACRDZ5_03530, partial [Acidimicrobiales bacterium]